LGHNSAFLIQPFSLKLNSELHQISAIIQDLKKLMNDPMPNDPKWKILLAKFCTKVQKYYSISNSETVAGKFWLGPYWGIFTYRAFFNIENPQDSTLLQSLVETLQSCEPIRNMGFLEMHLNLVFVQDIGTSCLDHLKKIVDARVLPTKQSWLRHNKYWPPNFSIKFMPRILKEYMDNVTRNQISAKIEKLMQLLGFSTTSKRPTFLLRVSSADELNRGVLLSLIEKYTFPLIQDQNTNNEIIKVLDQASTTEQVEMDKSKFKQQFQEFADFLLLPEELKIIDEPEHELDQIVTSDIEFNDFEDDVSEDDKKEIKLHGEHDKQHLLKNDSIVASSDDENENGDQELEESDDLPISDFVPNYRGDDPTTLQTLHSYVSTGAFPVTEAILDTEMKRNKMHEQFGDNTNQDEDSQTDDDEPKSTFPAQAMQDDAIVASSTPDEDPMEQKESCAATSGGLHSAVAPITNQGQVEGNTDSQNEQGDVIIASSPPDDNPMDQNK
jgi:hypothetical protein